MTLDDFMPEALRHLGDVVSLTVVAATLVSWLPAVAAGLSIIWTCVRLYDRFVLQSRSDPNP